MSLSLSRFFSVQLSKDPLSDASNIWEADLRRAGKSEHSLLAKTSIDASSLSTLFSSILFLSLRCSILWVRISFSFNRYISLLLRLSIISKMSSFTLCKQLVQTCFPEWQVKSKRSSNIPGESNCCQNTCSCCLRESFVILCAIIISNNYFDII